LAIIVITATMATTTDLLGYAGAVLAIIMFLSQMPMIYRMVLDGRLDIFLLFIAEREPP
jgi:hypothetical protein